MRSSPSATLYARYASADSRSGAEHPAAPASPARDPDKVRAAPPHPDTGQAISPASGRRFPSSRAALAGHASLPQPLIAPDTPSAHGKSSRGHFRNRALCKSKRRFFAAYRRSQPVRFPDPRRSPYSGDAYSPAPESTTDRLPDTERKHRDRPSHRKGSTTDAAPTSRDRCAAPRSFAY